MPITTYSNPSNIRVIVIDTLGQSITNEIVVPNRHLGADPAFCMVCPDKILSDGTGPAVSNPDFVYVVGDYRLPSSVSGYLSRFKQENSTYLIAISRPTKEDIRLSSGVVIAGFTPSERVRMWRDIVAVDTTVDTIKTDPKLLLEELGTSQVSDQVDDISDTQELQFYKFDENYCYFKLPRKFLKK